MGKHSLKFSISFLNINQRFLILDLQKLETMFKTTTFGKLMLVLLAIIIAVQGQFLKRDMDIDHKISKMVTITTGEPVQTTQTIQTKKTIVQDNGHHHDHSHIVFDGPEEEIVMRINLQFDKELKHFRIQQLNYENEDAEDEVIIQDVTQVKKISQNVYHTNNVVTTTKNVNQNVYESNNQQQEQAKPILSNLVLNLQPQISVESENQRKNYVSSKKAEEKPTIVAIEEKDEEQNPNNKWMRLFNLNNNNVEKVKSSEQQNSEDQAKSQQDSISEKASKQNEKVALKKQQVSAELPIVTKAKELLGKKASLSRHQDVKNEENSQETESGSGSTNPQGSISNVEGGSVPAEQGGNVEGGSIPAEQSGANVEGGSVPAEQSGANVEGVLAPVEQSGVNVEGGLASVEQSLPANNEGESGLGSAPATVPPQEEAQPVDAGFLSLFN